MSTPRTLIRITLSMDRPWAVGAVPDGRAEIDLPVLIDPRGGKAAYLPATSLVGALREHLSDNAEHWLGPLPGMAEQATGKRELVASRLWALGTRLLGADKHVLEMVTSTRIDGARAAAAAGSLRVEQSVGVKADAGVDWYLQADENVPDSLLDALSSWQPFIGRRRSSGLGRCHVNAVQAVTVDLDDADHLTWWLAGRHEWLGGAGAVPETATVAERGGPGLRPSSMLVLDWRVVEPLAVGTGESPWGADSSERAFRLRAGVPVIPGTAWKGVFRHRVEFILSACGADMATRTRIVGRLFGEAAVQRHSSGVSTGGRGMLRFLDTAIRGANGPKPPEVKRTHVAIDRLTGGARDGLLFTVRAIDEGAKTRTQIESDSKLETPIHTLLRHVARDIDDALVGVGGMTSRGYGTLRLTNRNFLDGLKPVDVDALDRALPELAGRDE